MSGLPDLAGNPDCDLDIGKELNWARIRVARRKSDGNVPYHIAGVLGRFDFKRRRTYWLAKGNLPLDVAEELYRDPVGRDIKFCGASLGPIGPLTKYYDKEGRRLLELYEKERLEKYIDAVEDGSLMAEVIAMLMGRVRFVEDPAASGTACVPYCHIRSEVALRLFADKVKEHGLI